MKADFRSMRMSRQERLNEPELSQVPCKIFSSHDRHFETPAAGSHSAYRSSSFIRRRALSKAFSETSTLRYWRRLLQSVFSCHSLVFDCYGPYWFPSKVSVSAGNGCPTVLQPAPSRCTSRPRLYSDCITTSLLVAFEKET